MDIETNVGGVAVESTQFLDACARALEATLREEICDGWHYSDYGNYATFDDLPEYLRSAVTKAASAVLYVASNTSVSSPGGEPGYAPGNCSAFNSLSTNQKWANWKSESGTWACKHCGTVLSDGPKRTRPCPGNSVCCAECDGELTRRTGGGQNDPFNWVLLPNAAAQRKFVEADGCQNIQEGNP